MTFDPKIYDDLRRLTETCEDDPQRRADGDFSWVPAFTAGLVSVGEIADDLLREIREHSPQGEQLRPYALRLETLRDQVKQDLKVLAAEAEGKITAQQRADHFVAQHDALADLYAD